MRYGLIAEKSFEALWINDSSAAPAAYDALLPLLQAKALMLFVRLGIVDLLYAHAQTAQELSRSSGLDETALRLLLRVVAAAGYAKCDGGRFSLTERSRRGLCEGARATRRAHIRFIELIWSAIGQMEGSLRSGLGLDMHALLRGEDEWAVYQQSMLEDARVGASVVAALLPVPNGARKLLDVAGAHGAYAAALCRTHPPMRGEVLELPEALEESMRIARAAGHSDVISHRAGNALFDDLGTGFDVAVLSNILHHLDASQCSRLMYRVRAALNRNGTVGIWDWRPSGDEEAPDLLSDGVALFFRTCSAGQCHATQDYCDWLREAGFTDVVVRTSAIAPQQALVCGRVAA